MTIAQPLHSVRIKAPYFSQPQQASLHRYLDADFINRFQQDIQNQQFQQTQFDHWLDEERHSDFDQAPVLRLPTHRAFHLICCEVVCERFGFPALDPQRITSAGFVIRRKQKDEEQAWIVEDGEAIGWQQAATELRDPDIHRRLCANGVLHQRESVATYSGEQVHPLHVLNTTDAKGKRHTLLYGYVPLGGFYYQRNGEAPFDKSSQTEIEQFASHSLLWPFGFHNAGKKRWLEEHSEPVQKGTPSKSFYDLLKLLVNRYHLGEKDRDANSHLEKLCHNIWFFEHSKLPAHLKRSQFNEHHQTLFSSYRAFSLTAYLTQCFAQQDNPIVQWLIQQEQKIDQAGGLDKISQLDPLPNSNGKGHLKYSLYMVASDAEELRHQLGQRFKQQTLAQAKEIPLPKFNQGKNDLYQIIPFVRSHNDQGKEQIQWSDNQSRSLLFRVAAPFDPEASSPSLIQMPGLRDLKRGLAKGASIITPGDTFDLINGLNLKKGASEDVIDEGPKLGIQWICSFSLPVITLVAMILLMIMISLLNIVFFWLPWVRICLPFPKIEK